MALQDRFDGLTPVAVGSPGHVWRARRRDVGDVVAVTLLDREVAEQAPRVAVRLAQVDDPHLVHVLDVVNDEGRTILIEQWVEGATLDRTIGDGGEISQQHAIATVIGVLDGLSVAHENGVAHGDLRPEVVLIESATGAPRLFGFGLGVPIPGTAARGTPETISPEAAAGRPPDPRSDVYSAGCLLFWLLTGTPPFVRSTAAAVLDAHVRNPMPWLPGAPSDVRQVVRSAMAKDPNARYASASEMADALHDAASRRFGEGWDDVSALASRAAGVAAELGPVAARSQGEDPTASPVDPATGTAPLRPAAPRA
ncbi:MAG TPA: serine/threonine-protein kinase, partial [Mycobacteriales bacterium]|nr:serine/threonine-protein kinase [Mycobacteriales bacterium]